MIILHIWWILMVKTPVLFTEGWNFIPSPVCGEENLPCIKVNSHAHRDAGAQHTVPWRLRSPQGHHNWAPTMSKHVPIKVIQGPYQVYQGLSRLSSTVTLIPPWALKSFYSLSRSLVPSRADWRLHFRTSYYSTFQMLFSNWLHATARKRAQPCPPLACQTWLQERLPCIWYHINTSCPTIHTQ